MNATTTSTPVEGMRSIDLVREHQALKRKLARGPAVAYTTHKRMGVVTDELLRRGLLG